jgi:hypothetical protein
MSTTGAEDALIVVLGTEDGASKFRGGGRGGEASPQTDSLFNRQKLTAEMADSSNLIKAEYDRIVGDMKLICPLLLKVSTEGDTERDEIYSYT